MEIAGLRMLIQPQRKAVLDDARDEGGRFARRQPFLGLPGELRVFKLRAQHETQTVPHIFRRNLPRRAAANS